jgi:hypothetical protein
MQKVLTANRLSDGAVVYLGAGGWSEWIDAASVAADETAAADLEARGAQAVAERQVVDPYLIDVISEGGHLAAARLRERIRAAGPTVRLDLGKQAMQERL